MRLVESSEERTDTMVREHLLRDLALASITQNGMSRTDLRALVRVAQSESITVVEWLHERVLVEMEMACNSAANSKSSAASVASCAERN